MVRPIGVSLLVFALLSLIVHQIGMFEFLALFAGALLTLDIMLPRFSKAPRTEAALRERLL